MTIIDFQRRDRLDAQWKEDLYRIFLFFMDELLIQVARTNFVVYYRDINNTFTLDHPSNGILDDSSLALDDHKSDWEIHYSEGSE